MAMGGRLVDLMDEAEQAGHEAGMHADLYSTIQKAKVGKATAEDWAFIQWACNCSDVVILPIAPDQPLPF